MTYKSNKLGINIVKALLVATLFTLFDGIIHLTIWNLETGGYFIGKLIISFYFAFIMFNYIFNIFKLKHHSFLYYFYYSLSFAVIHGLYYRVLELLRGQVLFSRVGDLNFGFIILDASTKGTGILIGILNSFIIHFGGFLIISILISRALKN